MSAMPPARARVTVLRAERSYFPYLAFLFVWTPLALGVGVLAALAPSLAGWAGPPGPPALAVVGGVFAAGVLLYALRRCRLRLEFGEGRIAYTTLLRRPTVVPVADIASADVSRWEPPRSTFDLYAQARHMVLHLRPGAPARRVSIPIAPFGPAGVKAFPDYYMREVYPQQPEAYDRLRRDAAWAALVKLSCPEVFDRIVQAHTGPGQPSGRGPA